MAVPQAVFAQGPPPPPPEMAAPEETPAPAQTHAEIHEEHANEVLPANIAHATPVEVFRLDFMHRALFAGLAVGIVCAYLGIFVVLRRVVFVGMALSAFSSAGVAFSLMRDLPPMLGSVGAMLAGTGILSVRWAPRKVRQDTVIGIGYVVATASAILLIAKAPKGETHLLDLLAGNIITVTDAEALATVLALGAVLLFHRLFAKELLFVSFDPDTAEASGYKTRVWEALLTLSIGIAIAFAIRAEGTLMTFASLVMPAVTALLLTRRMNSVFIVAMLIGALPVPIGLYLSFIWDLPPGATVVGIGFLFLIVAGLFSRRR
ncbi:MAG: metal ABC transporter permease [Armatimonas sp.]